MLAGSIRALRVLALHLPLGTSSDCRSGNDGRSGRDHGSTVAARKELSLGGHIGKILANGGQLQSRI